jgi:hypothetical protein
MMFSTRIKDYLLILACLNKLIFQLSIDLWLQLNMYYLYPLVTALLSEMYEFVRSLVAGPGWFMYLTN